jgi:hypothetical protein
MEESVLMKLPLILLDTGGEVTPFSSAEKVSRQLEAQDVRDGEYRLFDSSGVEFELSAESDSSPVVIGGPISSTPSFDFVRNLAVNYLHGLPTKKRASSPQGGLQSPEDVSRALGPYAE